MSKPTAQTFGKYQILDRIATGAMAEIYTARLEGIGGFQRIFAIKRILPHLSMNAEYVSMLVDEAKVAGLLSHANVVQILDLGQVEKVWYIAMEYVDGPDLGALLRRCAERDTPISIPHAVYIAIELLKGLEYAHQRQVMRGGRPVALNIVHRDVSPPNILLSFQGEVKVTDFGIARASLKAAETQIGVIKGRFDYMSPEQAAGARDLDARSDLFAVGIVLFEMLCGAHPFRTESEFGTLEAVREGNFTSIGSLNPKVPAELRKIMVKSLQVDRADRFSSATAFKDALDRFSHESGFVLSTVSLSRYLRSLFPERGGLKSGRDSGENPIVPEGLLPTPLDEPTDGPTRLTDAICQETTNAHASRFGLNPSEEATQIRLSPVQASPAAPKRRADSVGTLSLDLSEIPIPPRDLPPDETASTSSGRPIGLLIGLGVVILIGIFFGGVLVGGIVIAMLFSG